MHKTGEDTFDHIRTPFVGSTRRSAHPSRAARASVLAIAATALSFSTALSPASADDLAAFYRGKQIRLVINADAGGGYDLYARLVGRYLQKHIPGNPTIVPENMPGAGGHTAANWLYNIAPKDGTIIGALEQSTPSDQAMGLLGVQFDATRFNWIGNPNIDNSVTVVSRATGITSLVDLEKAHGAGIFCGDIGAGPTTTMPHVINTLLKSDIKIVSGYPGSSAIYLAMDRGELNCIGGTTWSSIKATHDKQLKSGDYKIVLQWGTQPDPEISAYAGHDVPVSTALAQSDLDKKAVDFINSSATIGKPLTLPPSAPADRIDALRRAFDETMRDPAFLAEAMSANMAIKPLAGTALQKLVTEVVHSSPEIVRRAKVLIGQDGS